LAERGAWTTPGAPETGLRVSHLPQAPQLLNTGLMKVRQDHVPPSPIATLQVPGYAADAIVVGEPPEKVGVAQVGRQLRVGLVQEDIGGHTREPAVRRE
jgi:hypothetical protein